MKNTPLENGRALARILARFGGRFLCRSPPVAGGGPPPRLTPATGPGPVRREVSASGRLAGRSRWRGVVRSILAFQFCVVVALIILTDPLCAAVLATGRRLRRPRPEKPTTTMAATVTPKDPTPG